VLAIGLISGTSADGIDAALVEVGEAPGGRLAAATRSFATTPYPPDVRAAVLKAAADQATTSELSKLNFVLGELFARAALDICAVAGVEPGRVDVVGSHGQTVWHDPFPAGAGVWRRSSTLQLGEPQVIAERTGIDVVAGFRARDVAAGGQGAPLVPLVDWFLLGDADTGRVALNLGGIANVTVLPAGGGPESVTGFDTGPGNMVIDAIASELTRGRMDCDRDGMMAAAGKVSTEVLTLLMGHPYFRMKPPKSTGREVFGPGYVEECLGLALRAGLGPEDLVATVTALTARSVASALKDFVPADARLEEVVVAGGGAHNPSLMGMLGARLGDLGLRLRPATEFGLSVDGKEATAFAVLACLTRTGRPGNLPGVTGAACPVVLGTTVRGARP